jgi:hypothetical protein
VVIYAILEKTKMLGENRSLHAIIAIAAAFLVILSKDILSIINFGAPWFVMVFVFLTLLLLIYRFFGASEADLTKVIKDKTVVWTILAIGLIIVIASISHVYGQKLLEKSSGEPGVTVEGQANVTTEGRSFQSEMYSTIFNPKILGLLLVFLIAVFSISLLTRESI